MVRRTNLDIGNLDSAIGQESKADDELLTMGEDAAIVRAPVATLRYGVLFPAVVAVTVPSMVERPVSRAILSVAT
jgi:hypothetical protein